MKPMASKMACVPVLKTTGPVDYRDGVNDDDKGGNEDDDLEELPPSLGGGGDCVH